MTCTGVPGSAGILPAYSDFGGSRLLPSTFTFKDPSGNVVLIQPFSGGNGNCVMNEQLIFINPSVFVSPGLYKVYATYWDGKGDAQIVNDWIGTGGQQVTLDVR